ncbi:MAG: ATP-binding protein [Phycisphaerae bacterium]|jgi:PAS domain S-box-containing protein
MNETVAKLRRLGALVLVGVFALGVTELVTAFAPHWSWQHYPVHAALEGFGAFAALTIALLILLLRRHEDLQPAHVWLASGMIGMGMLDGFHGAVHAGDSFVWLHSLATLIGGTLFACVWLPQAWATTRVVRALPAVMLSVSTALGIFSIAKPAWLPRMDGTYGFTPTAQALNVAGGIGFLAAASYFIVVRGRAQRHGALVWVSQCLLLGVAGILFHGSLLWDAEWWLWHVLRILAYGVTLYYFFALYHRGQVELQQSRDLTQQRVEERTKELARTNEDLRTENRERRIAERNLHITLSSIGDGVIVTDTSRTVVRLNRVAEELTGWRHSEALGRSLDEVFRIINEDTRAPAADPVGRVLQSGQIEGLANHSMLIARDGTQRAISDSAAPIQADEGEMLGVVLVFRDVTEERRRQVEKDQLLHQLGERVQELDCLYGLSRVIETPGLSILEILQRAAELLPPSSQYPEYAGARVRYHEAVFETSRFDTDGEFVSVAIEVRGKRVGDISLGYGEVPPEAGEGPLLEEERVLVGAIAERLGHVIGRMQAEEALRKSRHELAIRNRIARSFLTLSDDDMYTEVLKIVMKALESEYGVFGYIDEHGTFVVPTMTRHIWDKCQVADKRIVFPRESWGDSAWPQAIREKRTIHSNEPSMKVPAGHIPITRHVSLPIIHQGTVVGVIQVANKKTDYTEKDIRLLEMLAGAIAPVLSARLQRERQEQARAEAEQHLAVKATELARSNSELEQFAYIASHDLRAPLRAIDHLSQWIEEDIATLLTGETRENMQLLRGRVSRLEALLDDLLDYSRAGRVGTEVREMDTAMAVQDIVALLDPPVGFTVETFGILPTFRTAVGPLEQVLRNLIGNAIKHHDRTSGRVEVSVEEGDEFYEFTVADDGPGIPDRLRNKAFQMFQTLRPRDEVEGSGMGLAVVRKLVEWQGGTIRLDCGPDGRGAVFRFTWRKNWSNTEAEPCLTAVP